VKTAGEAANKAVLLRVNERHKVLEQRKVDRPTHDEEDPTRSRADDNESEANL